MTKLCPDYCANHLQGLGSDECWKQYGCRWGKVDEVLEKVGNSLALGIFWLMVLLWAVTCIPLTLLYAGVYKVLNRRIEI